MKPAPFVYHAPASLDETFALLDELRNDEAKILAGGQSLMPLMNMRLARPGHLVDINGLDELSFIRGTEDGGLAIGALTRHRTIERSPEVARAAPLLSQALPLIGDRQVRCRGTIGGSLAHADPVAEIPTVALALDAEMLIGNRSQRRTVGAADFFQDYFTTAIADDELLLEIRVPTPVPGAGFAFLELARQQGAFAIVSAAAMVALDADRRVRDVRLSLGGIGPTPLRARAAESELVGHEPTSERLTAAARLAAADTDPREDVHGSPDYRREVAAVYARRALELAASRAAVSSS